MANEKLRLQELGIRVEAMFSWPGNSGDPEPVSMPEVAAEIGERLEALERQLSPAPLDPEATTGVAAPPSRALDPAQLPVGGDPLAELVARIDELEQREPAPADVPVEIVEILEKLQARVEALAAEGTSPHTNAEIAEIRQRLESLDERLAVEGSSAKRAEEIVARLESFEERLAVEASSAKLAEEIVARLESFEGRLAEAQIPFDTVATILSRLAALEEHNAERASATAVLPRRVEEPSDPWQGPSRPAVPEDVVRYPPDTWKDPIRPEERTAVAESVSATTEVPETPVGHEPEVDPEVLEILRRDIAPLNSEFGPLTIAPDAVEAAPDASGEYASDSRRRFKKHHR